MITEITLTTVFQVAVMGTCLGAVSVKKKTARITSPMSEFGIVVSPTVTVDMIRKNNPLGTHEGANNALYSLIDSKHPIIVTVRAHGWAGETNVWQGDVQDFKENWIID
jgi:hypothetical protein